MAEHGLDHLQVAAAGQGDGGSATLRSCSRIGGRPWRRMSLANLRVRYPGVQGRLPGRAKTYPSHAAGSCRSR